ncbi:MAG TPA: thiamine-phosphate kinase [Xanthomonadales bacterium]|nr:thiamine-phosphate kinase [Xanthomonadales bacterium]
MHEFSLIELLTKTIGAQTGAMEGVGDDAAILPIPINHQLVVSTDTLVEGVHFNFGQAPETVGYKAMAASISDLAAMGASPAWFFLALTLPSMKPEWVEKFASGVGEVAQKAPIKLVGGDVTSGPMNMTLTVCGLVEPGKALLRSGAKPGDIVGISGPVGLAGRALSDQRRGVKPAPACISALYRPELRLGFGQALVGLASSCIDISDGLLADVSHISAASNVGIQLDLETLPCPPELSDLPDDDRWDLQLGSGDDYELCFTAAPERWRDIEKAATKNGVKPAQIGKVIQGSGCQSIRPDGSVFNPGRSGYVHGVHS